MVPPAGGGVPGRHSAASAAQLRVLEFLRDGRDLLHAVLVRGQVALEGLVLPQQGSQLRQRRRLVVLLQQDLFFACKGCSKSVPTCHTSASLCPQSPQRLLTKRKGGRIPGLNMQRRHCSCFRLSCGNDESSRLQLRGKPVGYILNNTPALLMILGVFQCDVQLN